MLTSLQVRDFAIVDQISVEFEPGMTVLTGETGAGKSILVDALGLVLGERGSQQLVRKGARRAEFNRNVRDFCRANGRPLFDLDPALEPGRPKRRVRQLPAAAPAGVDDVEQPTGPGVEQIEQQRDDLRSRTEAKHKKLNAAREASSVTCRPGRGRPEALVTMPVNCTSSPWA